MTLRLRLEQNLRTEPRLPNRNERLIWIVLPQLISIWNIRLSKSLRSHALRRVLRKGILQMVNLLMWTMLDLLLFWLV